MYERPIRLLAQYTFQDEATAQQVGMGIARNWSDTPTDQMWFFEGWLQAREEEM